jgi:hypothetical protein
MGEVVLAQVILDSEIIYPDPNPETNPLLTQQLSNKQLKTLATHNTTKALPNVSLKVWDEASEVAFKYYFLF